MHRHAFVVVCLSLVVSAAAQSGQPQGGTVSDPMAIKFAQQAMAALHGAGVQDITLTGGVTWIFGSDYQTGTGVLRANGLGQSRVDLSLSGGTRSDVRTVNNGVSSGAWQLNGGAANSYSTANCYADAAWFFPGLSSLAQANSTSLVFKYVGFELHGGINAQHIQIFQPPTSAIQQHLTTVDIYLDPVSFLPVAISANAHPDLDAATDIPSEVRFANYQSVNGTMVPFHIQRLLNGSVVMDITITNVAFNTGLPSSIFILQ